MEENALETKKEHVAQVIDKWLDGWSRKDVDVIMKFVASDVVLQMSESPSSVGIQAIFLGALISTRVASFIILPHSSHLKVYSDPSINFGIKWLSKNVKILAYAVAVNLWPQGYSNATGIKLVNQPSSLAR